MLIRMMFLVARPAALAFVLMISACGGGGGDTVDPPMDGTPIVITEQVPGSLLPNDSGTSDTVVVGGDIGDVDEPIQCNQTSQNQWAYSAMQDFYLFYDQVPLVDPQVYTSADELVKDVRFEERDQFSNVSDAVQASLAFEAGREFGLGFGLQYDLDEVPRISYVFTDSPIARAGIERGDIIVSVNDVAWLDALSPDLFNTVVGTPENPATARWQFQKAGTEELVVVELTAAEYAINTVLRSQLITGTNLSEPVGYLAFNRFLSTSEAELTRDLNLLQENNISDLILDLRYNGGGLVNIATGLATAIAGESLAGQPLYEYRYNDKYTGKNDTLTFLEDLEGLNLSRLIVLTSEQTASASEIVIAGLQPYIDVVTIGTRTTGKPYVSFSNERCGERLNIIEAEGFNAAGVSVFGGIPATCYAEDDLSQNFGVSLTGEVEGQLEAGLDYIANGSCAAAPVITAARASEHSSALDDHLHFGYGISSISGAVID